MTTTTALLLDLVVEALKRGKTDAGQSVFSPRSWPTWNKQYPVILCQAISERKESLGRASIQFNVISTIRISARTTAPAHRDDEGSIDAESAAWALQRQIETTVINSPLIMIDPEGGDRIQQFPTIDTQIGLNTEGEQPIAELRMDVGIEFYQGPEDFAPTLGVDLNEMDVNVDAINVADPSGTYTPPMNYQPTKAPRTVGPDGRIEGKIVVKFPEE